MTAPAHSTPAADLTTDRLLLAVILGVATRREQTKRRERTGTLIDDCIDSLRNPAFDPKVVRLHRARDPMEARNREIVAEAVAVLERIGPFARALAELDR